ncbi:hypothetical protein [Endozoicomonas acroporae]|uniref:hypothetical protein n=1 Tax=Endozoicomonas acroporae TaxID=1701104 RepID=UPI003D7902AE
MGLWKNQTCHTYLASGQIEVGNKLDSEEEDLITQSFSLEPFEQMLAIVWFPVWSPGQYRRAINCVAGRKFP